MTLLRVLVPALCSFAVAGCSGSSPDVETVLVAPDGKADANQQITLQLAPGEKKAFRFVSPEVSGFRHPLTLQLAIDDASKQRFTPEMIAACEWCELLLENYQVSGSYGHASDGEYKEHLVLSNGAPDPFAPVQDKWQGIVQKTEIDMTVENTADIPGAGPMPLGAIFTASWK